MPAKPLATTLGPLKWYNSSLTDVSMCALIQVKDILRMCREL